MMRAQPNVLLITTDQHRADHLGCYGAGTVRTPNIDALALRGTRFENAYVASPVCMPNRASLATGRMPSLHGVRHNGLNLDLGSNTFAEVLRKAGWHTSLSGKPHFQCVTTKRPQLKMRADGSPVAEARCNMPGAYDQEIGDLWRDHPDRELRLPYYGFQSVDLAVGHGDQVEGHYSRWFREQGGNPDRLKGPDNALAGITPGMFQAWRTAVPEHLYPTRYIQEKTIERLRSHAERPEVPFIHWASFCDPHHPFTPPGKYWDMYRPEDVDLPASFHAARGSDLVAELHRLRCCGEANLEGTGAVAVDEAELRTALALTYGMITMVDDAIGTIMAELGNLGLAENTIVIFLSDHGDLMGEHGLIFKGPYHYRSLIRTPLIWSDPRSAGPETCQSLVSSIDVSATILNAVGAEPFNGMQGISFIDRSGCPTSGRGEILIEDEIQSLIPGQSIRGRVRTLVSDCWRLTIYDGLDHGEFYNLADDPLELNNLWHSPEAASFRARMTEQLLRQMIAHSETSPLPEYAA